MGLIIRRCPKCLTYTTSEVCPKCGEGTESPHPPRYRVRAAKGPARESGPPAGPDSK